MVRVRTSRPVSARAHAEILHQAATPPRCLAAAVYKPDSFQDVDFISKSVGFAVGTPGSLYVTTNGGKVWLKSF